MEFQPFEKIPRLTRNMTVTEKLDGTNASVFIYGEAEVWSNEGVGHDLFVVAKCLIAGEPLYMRAGSRTRWITPDDDNYGFAKWVKANADDLFSLAVGHHFGEWWGQGIQRGYGLTEKRFSLFNVNRWHDGTAEAAGEGLDRRTLAPQCCHVVPKLLGGPFRTDAVDAVVQLLRERGSLAAPGFMRPEGVIVWHEAARQMFKKTLERDDAPKGQVR